MRNSAVLALDNDKTNAASINAIRANLERRLEQEGIPIVGSPTKAGLRVGVDQHMLMITRPMFLDSL